MMECSRAIRNEGLAFATTRVELEDIMLSESSQAQEDRYCMFSLICRKKVDLRVEESILVITRGWEEHQGGEVAEGQRTITKTRLGRVSSSVLQHSRVTSLQLSVYFIKHWNRV